MRGRRRFASRCALCSQPSREWSCLVAAARCARRPLRDRVVDHRRRRQPERGRLFAAWHDRPAGCWRPCRRWFPTAGRILAWRRHHTECYGQSDRNRYTDRDPDAHGHCQSLLDPDGDGDDLPAQLDAEPEPIVHPNRYGQPGSFPLADTSTRDHTHGCCSGAGRGRLRSCPLEVRGQPPSRPTARFRSPIPQTSARSFRPNGQAIPIKVNSGFG